MSYNIIIPRPVQKQLEQLPQKIYQRTKEKILELINEYRIRIGDYRVRYEIDDKTLTVIILSCRHRKDAYRD